MSFIGFSQNNNVIEKKIKFQSDTIQFDTVSVYQFNFEVIIDGETIKPENYYLNSIQSKIYFYENYFGQEITLKYEKTPFDLSKDFSHKNRDLIILDTSSIDFKNYIYTTDNFSEKNEDFFGSSGLQKQGSISRGVTVGNSQNLSLQSTLNLQLNGKIGPDLYIKGSISDDNIPFQPEGNTQKLQEFDQVYLQVYNDKFSVSGGDYWLNKPTGYFLNYTKRVQGASVEFNQPIEMINGKTNQKVSAAFSKGKFSRNIIQGVEGNQGPYKLIGADNEQFIIILAGTEKVYIDGVLLQRGQEFDYIIDYNTAEISFTANHLITKDKRMIVEFQYSDLNYARSIFVYNSTYETDKFKLWLNYYTEQDAKNQPIQQTLTDDKKLILANAGDSISNAISNSIDSIGFYDNRVLYKLIDTLGYDSVLVFSIHPDSAIYQAAFRFVGEGNGNYIFEKFTANGRVYRWVAPIAGTPQGNYEPIQLLIPPQKKQMFTVGGEYRLNKTTKTQFEFASSNQDINTFSKIDNEDDNGYAFKWNLESNVKLDTAKKWNLNSSLNFEFNDPNFKPIQWFRIAEFDRDWNIRNKNYRGSFYLSEAKVNLSKQSHFKTIYSFENLTIAGDYIGLKNNLFTQIDKNGWFVKVNGSWLISEGEQKTDFLRHESSISKNWKSIKIGMSDIHEKNMIYNANNELSFLTYQFYDIKAFISTSDSIKNKFEIYYQPRFDWLPDTANQSVRQTAMAQNAGINLQFLKNKNSVLKINTNYRMLQIIDSTLIDIKPENTLLNRLEHSLRLAKGAVVANTFYEIGSGLELKREFIFLEVNTGQGTHTWIDYNNDGVKDLGEFEIAQFADQASYIRVFIPTNEYIRTYNNQFTHNLFIKPEIIWSNKKGVKKALSKFSNQTVYKINRKTDYEDIFSSFNPFVYNIADTNLISINSTFRNTFFVNRTNSIFGMDYTYQENSTKILLSGGFDSRLNNFHKIRLRWNLSKYYNLKFEGFLGKKINQTDYAVNRNFMIDYYELKPIISYQPNTEFRLEINGKFSEKQNISDLMEKATIRDVGFELRYNQKNKGSFLTKFNFVLINYNAPVNTSIAFEMLEGLRTGKNFVWSLSYQKKVAKNLQLNFSYNGRKSEENPFIHSGGMELRAFF